MSVPLRIVLVLVVGAVAGLIAAQGHGSHTKASTTTTTCTPRAVLSKWSLAKLADQTIVVPAEETDVTALLAGAKAGYGGVILFGASAPSNLGRGLETLRRNVPDHLGFVVMTDEEGGDIQRMANLVGSMPWPSQMGATMPPSQIQARARQVASKMSSNGVNMDLAPVIDVDGRAVAPGASDPDGFRSFSGNTSVVEADGVAFLKGMLEGGVVPVVKHFPGLGGVSGNTDDGPASTLSWTSLQKVAIPPFVAASKAGVPAVMVSNAIVPGLTGRTPASLSYSAVTQELRRHLGFKGLIITDSLSAKAISDAPLSLSVPEAAVQAIEAGSDMMLFGSSGSTSRDLALAASISHSLVAAVGSKQLSEAQLVSAAAAVLAVKRINVCAG
jgi:beta-N-acetylhexosaminidase